MITRQYKTLKNLENCCVNDNLKYKKDVGYIKSPIPYGIEPFYMKTVMPVALML